jgi:hypothetical protein
VELAAVLALSLAIFPATPFGAEKEAWGEIAGRVVRNGTGAAGVLMEAHRDARGTGERTPVAAVESGADGSFVLSLPQGNYHLSARLSSSLPGPPVIVEHPDSPFSVTGRKTSEIPALDLSERGGGMPLSSGVKGRILIHGEPAADATVMLYEAKISRPVGPRYESRVVSSSDGSFQAAVPPGSYLIAVRKRMRGTVFGPPQPGDLAAEYGKNPVEVMENAFTETGDIPLHVVDQKRLERRLGSLDNPAASALFVSGKVVDSEGQYTDGLFVFLYGNREMTGPPVAVTRSGEGGGFVLIPPGPGRYYVAARRTYGAARQIGEEVGLIDGRSDSSVEVGEGDAAEGLLLRLRKVW